MLLFVIFVPFFHHPSICFYCLHRHSFNLVILCSASKGDKVRDVLVFLFTILAFLVSFFPFPYLRTFTCTLSSFLYKQSNVHRKLYSSYLVCTHPFCSVINWLTGCPSLEVCRVGRVEGDVHKPAVVCSPGRRCLQNPWSLCTVALLIVSTLAPSVFL